MRVLVTGGSGFLGKAIINALQSSHPDWTLANLDLVPPPTGTQPKVIFLKCDITDPTLTTKSINSFSPNAIIHTAGVIPIGPLRYSNSPALRSEVFSTNHQGTLNVLDAASTSPTCRSFVYTSSCTVITDDQNHDFPNMTETLPTGHATLTYGASKTAAETAVLAANTPENLLTCALRPATIIGPGDSCGVIATIHTCIANKETPWIIGTGDNLYDIVYVTNVADAHILALENLLCFSTSSNTQQHTRLARNDENGKQQERKFEYSAAGQSFFISNHQPIYFRDFMLAIWAHFDHYPPFQFHIPVSLAWWFGLAAEFKTWVLGTGAVTLSRGSVKDAVGTRYASNEKAKRVLGYHPRVDFVEAVALACEDHGRVLRGEGRG